MLILDTKRRTLGGFYPYQPYQAAFYRGILEADPYHNPYQTASEAYQGKHIPLGEKKLTSPAPKPSTAISW